MILETWTESIKFPTIYLSDANQDEVVSFLERDDDWHHFEYMLYAELVYFMDEHHSKRAFRIMVRSFAKRQHPENDRQAYQMALMNAIMRPIETGDLEFAGEIMKMIDGMKLSPIDIFTNYRRELCRCAFAFKQNGGEEQREILQNLLGSLDFLGSPQLAASDMLWLKRCGVEFK
jgi:Rgg/GadR/MutR family transcriptional activator